MSKQKQRLVKAWRKDCIKAMIGRANTPRGKQSFIESSSGSKKH